MALDLKVSVKRHMDGLSKELAAVTRRQTALRGELDQCEQFYRTLGGDAGMDGKEQPKQPKRGGRPRVQRTGVQRTEQKPKKSPGRRGSMIDWNAIFQNLPAEFSLDNLESHKIAREKPRAYLRQVVVRWSKEGRIKRTSRGKYQKA